MELEPLAQQLIAFSERQDRSQDLVVRAGAAQDVYFRFSVDDEGSPRLMGWEARPRGVGEQTPESDEQRQWLARMDFRKDGDGLLARSVAVPSTIEAARLIAGLASFLLDHAYVLPEDAVVSIALEDSPEEDRREAEDRRGDSSAP